MSVSRYEGGLLPGAPGANQAGGEAFIGVVAPSGCVPRVELEIGLEHLRLAGLHPRLHPQVLEQSLFFAGDDASRLQGFLDFAYDPHCSVLWCARGGYGAMRLLEGLVAASVTRGKPPKKLLIGFSDITALFEFVRGEWGWSILHAPMVSSRTFSLLPAKEWQRLLGWVRKQWQPCAWEQSAFQFWVNPPQDALRATLLGGNLTVWNALLGSTFHRQSQRQSEEEGYFLFFEEVDEALYRVDRLLQQLLLTVGRLRGLQAVIVGEFSNCQDRVGSVLREAPPQEKRGVVLRQPAASELMPLRAQLETAATLRALFVRFGEALGVPVLGQLPVGHSELGCRGLPLGAQYRLSPSGQFELLAWDWLETLSL